MTFRLGVRSRVRSRFAKRGLEMILLPARDAAKEPAHAGREATLARIEQSSGHRACGGDHQDPEDRERKAGDDRQNRKRDASHHEQDAPDQKHHPRGGASRGLGLAEEVSGEESRLMPS